MVSILFGAWGGAARGASFGAAETAIIDQVERYLNAVSTLKARFLQMSANGAYAEGELYLSRPGRMRMNYDPPDDIEVVADGRFLIFHDRKLEQVTYLGLDSSPAGILLRPKIALSGDVTVTEVHRLPGALEISVVQTEDRAAGELTMLLSENPLALKQWRVRDAQGQVVTVSLFGAERGVTLAPELFEFYDPKFSKPAAQ